MKKILLQIAIPLVSAVALSTQTVQGQPLTLSGTNYFQSFDNLGSSGLPGEWLVYTNAKSTQLGTLMTLATPPSTNWSYTSFGFRNYASTVNGGTNLLGSETTADQMGFTNRALGVRPVGASDPGCAFVLKLTDTGGFGKFKLDVDFLLLNPQTRSNYWSVDFGVSPDGSSPPTTFTTVSNNVYFAYGNFGATHKTIDFGGLLDNQPGPIWIRIVNLTFSSGSGNRPTVGIDNFSLSFTNAPPVVNPPKITSPPRSVNAFVGDYVSFSVANTGTAPFTYQWYHPDLSSPIDGAWNPTYTINNIALGDAGNYYVIVSNDAGSDTNLVPAVLTVGTRIPIVTTIAYLRQHQDPVNWVPIDTTNLYTVQGVVITQTNMTTAVSASFFIEDTNSLCGIDVFDGGGNTIRPAAGDLIQVTGPVANYNGLLEFNLSASNPTHIVTNLGPTGYVVPAKPFNIAAANNVPSMETNVEGSLVTVANVYIQNGGLPTTNFLAYSTVLLTNLSGQTFQLYIDPRLTDIIGQPIPQMATITGYMSQFQATAPYTTNYQLVPTRLADIVAVAPPISLSIQLNGNNCVLQWSNPAFSLQWAPSASGTYATIPGASSPYTEPIGKQPKFYRLAQ